ncbi:MAG: hypothetical protein JXA82_14135 [Sedimentisphaerales bacterium]|nr:hypothetical protein [Sedimentisphaerales bacterium]
MVLKRCLTGILAIAFLFGMINGIGAQEPAEKENPALRWEEDIRKFEAWDDQNAWPRNPVLFVGSSSIRLWKTRESFPDLPVINRGFGGSQTSDVLYYTERIVLKYRPRLIVLYCGDNDIASGKEPDQVFQDYRTFVSRVHKALPRTRIIYISIKASGARWNLWPKMKQANEMIAELSKKDSRLFYADCATCLLKDGTPDDSLFVKDRLHLNPDGYKVWTGVIKPIIEKANPNNRR